jgi:small-conductance mechanosensitive channel
MKNIEKRYRFKTYIALAVLMLVVHHLLGLDMFKPWEDYIPLLEKLTISLTLIFGIILITNLSEKLISSESRIEGDRYNLLRIVRLISIISIIIVIVSFLFQNLYAVAVSFGLISLVLGFALQAPIASFIAWIYIVFRRPYQVGHRIQIGKHKGDVVEINYLDTMLWECSGDYLTNDRRSGRIIHFPNSLLLKEEIINYSGPQSPFIWNETPVQIAFTSDIVFVEQCLIEAAKQDFEREYRHDKTIVIDDWMPSVYFRVNQNSWLEAVISYPVEPEDTTGRRNRILRLALPMLNRHPEKVQFPEGSRR